ncbi:hypothetical protein BCR42DRAFT_405972 [Absidia repens]|uniref:C2 domain-containing protein n=1 Tax=Absidia repens TaxID=90262 RepID=A0A1X2IU79_9FUNG|nr:hypothetical protein BCR42DRAFT_405972 [Absidia repens]
MTIGNLQVTAVTIRGLAENGIHNVNAFLGCYIDVSDKHRTQTQQGPEPQWNQSLSLSIPESKTTLYLEVVNENPSDAGVIGRGSYDFSPVVYQNVRLDDIWVPIYSTNNGTSTVGHVLIRLDKQHTQQQQQHQQQGSGGPPAYSGSFGSNDYPQEKQQPPTYDRQSSFASLGPDQPLPENYGTGNPPPFTPPATSSNNPPAYPTSSYSPPQAGGYAMPGASQPEQTSQQGQKEKEKSTDWMVSDNF